MAKTVARKAVKKVAKVVTKTARKPVAKKIIKAVVKTAAKKITATLKSKVKTVAKPVVKSKAKPLPKSKAGLAVKPKVAHKLQAKVKSKVKTVARHNAPVSARAIPQKMAVAVAPQIVPKYFAKSKPYTGTPLTEQEVIKQSKTDYMNAAQLAFFRQRLLDLQIELRSNAGITTEHLRDISVAPDPADRATQEEEHALELRTRDRERKLLKKVESTLMRINDGSYGYCEETGDPIGIQRLLARPTATLTIEAQERRELKQKMYGE